MLAMLFNLKFILLNLSFGDTMLFVGVCGEWGREEGLNMKL